MMGKLNELSAKGTAVWLDFVDRKFLEAGGLRKLVEEDAVTGVTSNPTIFGKAMSQGDAYDASLATFDRAHPDAAAIDRYEALAVEAGDRFNYTFGDPGDGPGAYWRQQEHEGHPVLLQLARVLNLPSVERDELEGTPYRSWPSADQEHRTQADWDALRGLYADEQVAQFQRDDMYTGWRTAITDAGQWMYFVSGD